MFMNVLEDHSGYIFTGSQKDGNLASHQSGYMAPQPSRLFFNINLMHFPYIVSLPYLLQTPN